jgi:hypothetical protein
MEEHFASQGPASAGILVLVVHGAYGRDYDAWEPCLKDWEAGKDFRLLGGPYCSVRDVPRMQAEGVKMLYFVTGRAEHLGHIQLGPNGHDRLAEGVEI